MCVGVEILAFDVLLRIESKQKAIGNWFCAPIIFKNPLKPGFTICVGRVWIVIRYFLFEKHAFNKLLRVIGIQILIYQVCLCYASITFSMRKSAGKHICLVTKTFSNRE